MVAILENYTENPARLDVGGKGIDSVGVVGRANMEKGGEHDDVMAECRGC